MLNYSKIRFYDCMVRKVSESEILLRDELEYHYISFKLPWKMVDEVYKQWNGTVIIKFKRPIEEVLNA